MAGDLGAARAAEGNSPPAQSWSFQGVFGTYDRADLKRGFQVYTEVCASCHSLKLVSYRHLRSVGFSEDEVKAIAAEFGFPLEILRTSEFTHEDYTSNPVNRCYYCKHELYTHLGALARQRGFRYLADGSNADDHGDDRTAGNPGSPVRR